MKKSIKFLAVFAFCFSVLANCLPTYAAAPSKITCTVCGRTANFYSTEERAGTVISQHIVESTGETCYVSNKNYLDTYMCSNCGLIRVFRREEKVHSISHQ